MEPTSETLLHRGVALAQAGDRSAAIAAFREAVRKDAANWQAWRNLGAALKGVGSLEERIACYGRALAIEDDPYTRANLAAALLDAGDAPRAVAEAKAAAAALPVHLPAWINLGLACCAAGNHAGAKAAYGRALLLEPENADALHGLGTLLNAMQRFEDAVRVLGRAEALRPDDHKIGVVAARARQQAADWSRYPEDFGRMVRWVGERRVGLPPFNLLSVPGMSGRQQRDNAAVHADAEFSPFYPAAVPDRPPRHGRPLRVGYLTADLRAHVIGRLMGPVLQHSAGRAHEVLVYDLWPGANPVRDSLIPHVAAWRDVSRIGVRDTAAQIAADGIDVLVDMTGYTGNGRTGVMACRPAPVLVNYLGYPGSLGSRRVADYILTDRVTSPIGHADHYAEALAWLPGSLLPPVSLDMELPETSRARHGLPEDALVLAAFHNGYKLNPTIFAEWMRILRSLPDAVLWLLAPTAPMRDRLCAAAQAQGCPSHRLRFYAGGTYADYLAALSLADLFLDAQPYTAGGTARDALMVGVPMVTALGDGFAGRMAASACLAEGVPDCVAPSLAEYAPLALRLAADAGLRRGIAERLAQSRHTGPGRVRQFAESLDRLYQTMADRHDRGIPVGHLALDLPNDPPEPPVPPDGRAKERLPGPTPMPSSSIPSPSPARTVLHVGCGVAKPEKLHAAFHAPGWRELRFDIDPRVAPDVVGSMTAMDMIADGSVAAVWSSHNLEHLYPHEVGTALAEFRRVLAPGGLALITVPDLQRVAELVAQGNLEEEAYGSLAGPIAPIDIIYGHRPSLAHGNLFMAHRTGFIARTLAQALMRAGFAQAVVQRDEFDLWAVAYCQQQPPELTERMVRLRERLPECPNAEPAGRATLDGSAGT